MDTEELIDDLIEDGYFSAWIHWAHLKTDEENVLMTERLILDTDGNILARRICPPDCYGWSRLYWSTRSPLFPIPQNAMVLDLTDKETAISTVEFFGHI